MSSLRQKYIVQRCAKKKSGQVENGQTCDKGNNNLIFPNNKARILINPLKQLKCTETHGNQKAFSIFASTE